MKLFVIISLFHLMTTNRCRYEMDWNFPSFSRLTALFAQISPVIIGLLIRQRRVSYSTELEPIMLQAARASFPESEPTESFVFCVKIRRSRVDLRNNFHNRANLQLCRNRSESIARDICNPRRKHKKIG